jgi:hypothetical protein
MTMADPEHESARDPDRDDAPGDSPTSTDTRHDEHDRDHDASDPDHDASDPDASDPDHDDSDPDHDEHDRDRDASERARDDAHLQDVDPGAGCTEIWEHLSETRDD